MATHSSNESTQERKLQFGADIGQGKYGPIRLAIDEAGQLLAAEAITASLDLTDLLPRLQLMDRFVNKDHPNIIKYYGYQEIDNRIYLLSEYISGGSLQDLISKFGPIGLSLVSKFLAQVLLGLEQLHSQGHAVVFLSLNEVFLDHLGKIRLARPLLDMGFPAESLPTELTTLPEIHDSQGNMLKADVWLLGIITIQLLTGQLFKPLADNTTSTMEAGQNQESAWSSFMPSDNFDFDPMTIEFLSKCFTINPENRPNISDLRGHPFLNMTE